jgi:hypothetical protein
MSPAARGGTAANSFRDSQSAAPWRREVREGTRAGRHQRSHCGVIRTSSDRTLETSSHLNRKLTDDSVVKLVAAQVSPIAWIGPDATKVIVRLGLIVIPRIEVSPISRPQFSMVIIGHTQTSAAPARRTRMADDSSARR